MSIESSFILKQKYLLSAYYDGLRSGDIAVNIKDWIFAIKGRIYVHMYRYVIKHHSAIKRKKNRERG